MSTRDKRAMARDGIETTDRVPGAAASLLPTTVHEQTAGVPSEELRADGKMPEAHVAQPTGSDADETQ